MPFSEPRTPHPRQSQKLETMGMLAAGIAHELSAPLQAVGDNTHFLGEAFGRLIRLLGVYRDACRAGTVGSDTAGALEAAETDLGYLEVEIPLAVAQMREAIGRGTEIVRAMKTLAHPGDAEMSPADLHKVILGAMLLAKPRTRDLAVVTTDFGDLPHVVCQPGLLNQVFLNLLLNAADAIAETPGTGVRGSIRIRTRLEDTEAVVEIADSGAGIPPAVRDRIFEPFFTTKAVGVGTGQGLAIARAIIEEEHEGRISLESERGQGTTFRVRLPVSGPARRASRRIA
ncbi:MAG: sensor histidine kinase [Gemmatimonadales bacterium]